MVGTLINVAGVRLVIIINNIGVVAEIIGMFGFALVLLIFFNHQSLSFLTTTSPVTTKSTWRRRLDTGVRKQLLWVFAAALFMSLFVIYGFDTAGTLGEETKDPQKNAPRGVLWAVGLSAIAGFLFLGGTILSIKNLNAIERRGVPVARTSADASYNYPGGAWDYPGAISTWLSCL